jgi:starvation-inducible DNA-binding protein
MGAAAMYQTSIDLNAVLRSKVICELQARLADAVDLFTQIKQAHWNVKGPNFMALHELFDSIAEIIEDQSDQLAERITALGGRADGTARIAASLSAIQEYPFDIENGREHVVAVADRLAAFACSIRATIDQTAVEGDAGSADLFTEMSREIDKQLWFVEAHLQAET